MPRDSNGNYSLPAGYLAEAGQTIQPSQHNPPLEDLATSMTASLPRTGSAPMTGPLKLSDGSVSAPALAFASVPSSGWYKTTSGIALAISGALAVEFDATGIVTGVTTASIPDKAVTYRKIQQPSGPSKLLGSNSNPALTITGTSDNGSGLIRLTVASTATFATSQKKTVADVLGTTEANGTWTITVVDGTKIDLQGSTFTNAYVSGGTIGGAFEEVTIGAGLTHSGSTLTAAFPPQGAYRRLVIKVTGNTAITVSADYVTTTDGNGRFQTTPVSSSVNMATSGVVDALDTGGIASGTWYYGWVIAKADGTTKVIYSLQATANATFLANLAAIASGAYTFYAYIGAVRTAAGSAQLMGTWQLGNRVQYVLSLAQTSTALPTIASLGATYWTVASLASVVPSTATVVYGHVLVTISAATTATYGINANSVPTSSSGSFYRTEYNPASSFNTSYAFNLLLESGSIYHGQSNTNSGTIHCAGWVDNI